MVNNKMFVDITGTIFMLCASLLDSTRSVACRRPDSLHLCKKTGTRGMADVGLMTAYICARELVHFVNTNVMGASRKEVPSFEGLKLVLYFVPFLLRSHLGAVFFQIFSSKMCKLPSVT